MPNRARTESEEPTMPTTHADALEAARAAHPDFPAYGPAERVAAVRAEADRMTTADEHDDADARFYGVDEPQSGTCDYCGSAVEYVHRPAWGPFAYPGSCPAAPAEGDGSHRVTVPTLESLRVRYARAKARTWAENLRHNLESVDPEVMTSRRLSMRHQAETLEELAGILSGTSADDTYIRFLFDTGNLPS